MSSKILQNISVEDLVKIELCKHDLIIDSVIALLNSTEADIIEHAVTALRNVSTHSCAVFQLCERKSAFENLAAHLSAEDDTTVRTCVATAFANCAVFANAAKLVCEVKGIDLLGRNLNQDGLVALESARAIANLTYHVGLEKHVNASIVKALIALLSKPDLSTKANAARAIRNCSVHSPVKIDVRQCGGIDALVNTLSSNHDELKVHSCVAIHNCLAGADPTLLKGIGQTAIPLLLKCLSSENVELIECASWVLGRCSHIASNQPFIMKQFPKLLSLLQQHSGRSQDLVASIISNCMTIPPIKLSWKVKCLP